MVKGSQGRHPNLIGVIPYDLAECCPMQEKLDMVRRAAVRAWDTVSRRLIVRIACKIFFAANAYSTLSS